MSRNQLQAKYANESFGVYVHIPYCQKKCPYCDFYTRPVPANQAVDRYVSALTTEISRATDYGWAEGAPLDTIFLGGGTPSLLPGVHLEKIMGEIHKHFSVSKNAEVTIEINPETVTEERVRSWRMLGINRASMGVQTLRPDQLLRLGREHHPDQAHRAFQILRSAGFKNVSVDLMFGLEGQTTADWMQTLSEIILWDPEHISAYNLTVETRTPYGTELKEDRLQLPDENVQTELFETTRSVLEKAGYFSYEISNFSKPGFEARHNLIYWEGNNYWGVGASAHSFQRISGRYQRWWNPRDEKAYVSSLESGQLPTEGSENLTPLIHWGERLMTGLRLAKGVNLSRLSAEMGISIPHASMETLHRFAQSGHIRQIEDEVRLTPQGTLLSNEIFRELLA